MAHWTLHGTVRYTSKKPGRLDRERGREYFTMSEATGDVRVRQAPFCAALAVLWGEHA